MTHHPFVRYIILKIYDITYLFKHFLCTEKSLKTNIYFNKLNQSQELLKVYYIKHYSFNDHSYLLNQTSNEIYPIRCRAYFTHAIIQLTVISQFSSLFFNN